MSLNLIPGIGGALNEVLSHRANNLKEKRLTNFIYAIEENLKDINENKINKTFLDSEEFTDLTFRCINLSLRTNSIEKVKLFALILKNSLLVSEFKIEEFEEIEFLFDQISSREFFFLQRLAYWDSIKEARLQNSINEKTNENSKNDFKESNNPSNAFEIEMIKNHGFTQEEMFIIGKTCEQKGLVEQPQNINSDRRLNIISSYYRKTKSGYLMTIKPTILYEHMVKFIQINETVANKS